MVSNFLFLCLLFHGASGVSGGPSRGSLELIFAVSGVGKEKSPPKPRHFNVGLLTGTKIRGKYRIAGVQKGVQRVCKMKRRALRLSEGGCAIFYRGCCNFLQGCCNFLRGGCCNFLRGVCNFLRGGCCNFLRGVCNFLQGVLQFFTGGAAIFYMGCKFRKGFLHLHHLLMSFRMRWASSGLTSSSSSAK